MLCRETSRSRHSRRLACLPSHVLRAYWNFESKQAMTTSLFGRRSKRKMWRNYGGEIEELKKEKRTLKTSITKLLNVLAAELSTKTPNKGNVKEKLQDIDMRRVHGLLDLLDSL